MGCTCSKCMKGEKPRAASRSTGTDTFEAEPHYIALFDREAVSDAEIAFKKGDLFEVEWKNGDGEPDWLFVSKVSTDSCIDAILGTGYVPKHHIALAGSIDAETYFYPEFSRYDLEKRLKGAANGTFLVREYEKSFFLSVVVEKQIREYPVEKSDKFGILDRKFSSMNELIDFYKRTKLDDTILISAVNKDPPSSPLLPPLLVKAWRNLPRSAICIERRLGEGNFGVVSKGTITINGITTVVAVKELKRPQSAAGNRNFVTVSRRAFFREAVAMKDCTNVNLVKLLGVVSDKLPFWILSEYVNGGDLKQYMQRQEAAQNWFDENQFLDILFQISSGMKYLETKNIVHHDLYAKNIFVEEKDGSLVVKIGDFGLAKLVKNGIATLRQSTAQNAMAPEIFARNMKYSNSIDVFSFGVVMFEILSYGKDLPAGLPIDAATTLLNSRTVWRPIVIEKLSNLAMRCRSCIPSSRPTFAEICVIFDGLRDSRILVTVPGRA